jgi:hypothetical protein
MSNRRSPHVLKYVALGATIAAALALAWLARAFVDNTRELRANGDAWEALGSGMSVADVARIRGRAPDCTTRVRRSRALYFWSTHVFFGGVPPCPVSVDGPAALPRMYGSLQVLIDPENLVSVVAFEGEARLKASKPFDGEMLRQLPDAYVQ